MKDGYPLTIKFEPMQRDLVIYHATNLKCINMFKFRYIEYIQALFENLFENYTIFGNFIQPFRMVRKSFQKICSVSL